jgi:ribosomal protein S18 acetylase RimI-like enzyme
MSKSAEGSSLSIVRLRKPDHEILVTLAQYDLEAFGPTGFRTYDLAVMAEAGAVFLARLGDDLIGACQVIRVMDEPAFCYIAGIYVRPAWQGQGFGREFLMEVAAKCRSLAAEGLLLTVSPTNTRALALYKSVGFAEEDFVPHFYGEGEDRYVFRWRF